MPLTPAPVAAISGSYDFVLPIDELLLEGFERLGISWDAPTARQVRSVRRSLNLLFAQWSSQGVNLWAVERMLQPLTFGQASFTMPPGSIDILEMTIRGLTGNELPMTAISRTDYAYLPNKDLLMQPSQYWVSRLNPVPEVHLYPTSNGIYTLTYYRMRQMQDVTVLYQLPDAPYQWSEAITAGLTAKLAEKYKPERFEEKSKLAGLAFAIAAGENRERVITTMALDYSDWG